MRLKFIALVAFAAFGLTACESAPEPASTTGTTTTTGGVGTLQDQLRTEVGDRVFFDFDRSDVRSDAQGTLTALAAWLNAHPEVTLTLEGHADERGTREYNLALGERRANSTRQFLISLGVDANRLAVISYGEERPDALGSDEISWAQNRRAVFIVN